MTPPAVIDDPAGHHQSGLLWRLFWGTLRDPKWLQNVKHSSNLFKRRTGSALHLKCVTESQSILDRLVVGSDLTVVESRAVGSDLTVVESRAVGLDFKSR